MSYRPGLYLSLLIMVIHGFALGLDWYGSIPTFDVYMHFSGGLAMGLIALALRASGSRTLRGSTPWWMSAIFVIGFVALIGVLWEFHEFVLDLLSKDLKAAHAQASLGDTMADLFFDLLGGTVAVVGAPVFSRFFGRQSR